MKTYEAIVVPVEQQHVIETTCDKCGTKMVNLSFYITFKLEVRDTVIWPDKSGYVTGWKVEDLCNFCINDLKKLLLTNGFKLAEINETF